MVDAEKQEAERRKLPDYEPMAVAIVTADLEVENHGGESGEVGRDEAPRIGQTVLADPSPRRVTDAEKDWLDMSARGGQGRDAGDWEYRHTWS